MDSSAKATQPTAKATDPAKVSVWERTKAATKAWFEKVGPPINKLSNKLGAETFWPTPLDKESEKAARILRSFCIDGMENKQGTGNQGIEEAAGKQGADKKHKPRHQIPQEASSSSLGTTPLGESPSNQQ